jgi:hypothetical protein
VRLRWLRWSAALLGVAASAGPVHGQTWDDRKPNVVAAGFGANTGGLGVSYRRQLPAVPIALGAGFGVLGPAVHIDLMLPPLRFAPPFASGSPTDARPYIGLGTLTYVNDATSRRGAGDVFIEAGAQTWPAAGDRFFTDFALGVMVHAWGSRGTSGVGPSLRAQIGYAF